jgi:hypothetical protein
MDQCGRDQGREHENQDFAALPNDTHAVLLSEDAYHDVSPFWSGILTATI